MATIIKLILEIIIIFLLPIITGFAKYYADKCVKAWIGKIQDEEKRKKAEEGYQILINSAYAIKQTYVDELKAQGKFDMAAQEAALVKAKNQAIDLMDSDIKLALADKYGDVDKFMTMVIESVIAQYKK